MEKRILGRTGIELSVFGLGGIVVINKPQDEADRIVREAIDYGMNYVDIAPSYGNSEEILGRAIHPYRNKITLACKTEKRTKAEAMEALHASLKTLKTDYFDVYQLHTVTHKDEVDAVLAPGGALEALVDAKAQGLIRYIGFSGHSDVGALELIKNFDFDTILYPINWVLMLKKSMGPEVLKVAAERNMGRIAIKALAYGAQDPNATDGYENSWYRPIYDDDELAELALRFTVSQDINVAISPGDYRMLKLGRSIFDKYNGNLPKLNDSELAILKERALKTEPIIFQ